MCLLLSELLRFMPVHPIEAFSLNEFVNLGGCNAGKDFLWVVKENDTVNIRNLKGGRHRQTDLHQGVRGFLACFAKVGLICLHGRKACSTGDGYKFKVEMVRV